MEFLKTGNKYRDNSPHGAGAVRHVTEDLRGASRSFYIVLSSVLLLYLLFEWREYAAGYPQAPAVLSVTLSMILAFCVYKIITFDNEVMNRASGADYVFPGARHESADWPEGLGGHGFRVLEDEVRQGLRPRNVLISEKGVFAVETRTLDGTAEDGGVVENLGPVLGADGYMLIPNPVQDLEAEAAWLGNTVMEATGKDLPVTPVILFPGMRVENNARPGEESVVTLNPEDLPAFIRQRSATLTPEDMDNVERLLTGYRMLN
ncbi:MAG: nuclease-related domain-containing protein [Deltaproteobacteria bacterium]